MPAHAAKATAIPAETLQTVGPASHARVTHTFGPQREGNRLQVEHRAVGVPAVAVTAARPAAAAIEELCLQILWSVPHSRAELRSAEWRLRIPVGLEQSDFAPELEVGCGYHVRSLQVAISDPGAAGSDEPSAGRPVRDLASAASAEVPPTRRTFAHLRQRRRRARLVFFRPLTPLFQLCPSGFDGARCSSSIGRRTMCSDLEIVAAEGLELLTPLAAGDRVPRRMAPDGEPQWLSIIEVV